MVFSNSLQQETSQRGWSQSETSGRGRISQQTTSRVLNRQTQPTAVACRGIARALDMPLAEVLERAGLPIPQADKSTIARLETPAIANTRHARIDHYLRYLSEDDLDHILWFARELSRRR